MNELKDLQSELKSLKNPEKISVYKRFFKTGPGEYGYGDEFYGIPVPVMRKVLKNYLSLPLEDLKKLLESKIHEERFIALQILVSNYKKSDDSAKKKIYNFYMANIKYINNWDLVDTSAPQIVGGYLFQQPRDILYKFARSNNLWKKRISVLATFFFIRKNDYITTLEISEILLKDEHDLIHKAVGWMIREVGNRNIKIAEDFVNRHASVMPRTMLRYAIEKFPEAKRKAYMAIPSEARKK